MASDREHHALKMVAILHADVAGSTTLVQLDESLAHTRIKATFNRFSQTIEQYGGTVHEIRGDALVAEFPRASDAVSAALVFQSAHSEHLAQLTDEIVPSIRIGISLGEVIFADSTVTGAGVVLAQRLEQLAESGGVCIQQSVYEMLPRRMPFDYLALGEQHLKGFDEPVRAYTVTPTEGAEIPSPGKQAATQQPRSRRRVIITGLVGIALVTIGVVAWWQLDQPKFTPASVERMAFPLPEKPSIAVLPFDNLSGDPKQEYFADGITETIIGQLSKTPQLFVIARNSSFTYKNKPTEVRQVSEELGVRYVLEGSVQRSGDRIRMHAQLVDATSGEHIWSEIYDRQVSDIFAVQDDIALIIASTIDINTGQIAIAERNRVRGIGTKNLPAWDHVVRSLAHWWKFKKDANILCREEAKKAIALDLDFARPYAFVAWTHLAEVWMGWADTPTKSISVAKEWAREAIARDPNEYHGYWTMAFAHMFSRQFDKAGVAFEKALKLNPNAAQVLHSYGWRFLVPDGRSAEALVVMSKARRLNPHHSDNWLSSYAIPLYILGRYDEAIEYLKQGTKLRIDKKTVLAGSYAQIGQMEKARAVIKQVLRERPEYSLEKFGQSLQFRKPEDATLWLEGPRKAGLPEKSPGKGS